jgi:pilus assembly protein FimV
MRFKKNFIYLVLASLSLSAAAMTLGRARGAAWIGQPLDLAVAVQMENDQASGGLCAEADVFYADTKIDPARVQVSLEKGLSPDAPTLRIQSSVPVDEPVVTIYLRAGCSNKSTRRFVLLADYPTENAPPATQSRIAEPVRLADVPEAAPAALPAPTAAVIPGVLAPANFISGSVSATPTANSVPTPAPAQEPTTKATPPATKTTQPKSTPPSSQTRSAPSFPAPKSASKPSPAQSTKPTTPAGARLKLDPLENLTERIKTLEATTTSPPAQEVVQDSARIQQLQGDVKALLAQAAKSQESLALMRDRLEKAEAQQQPSFLVYVLLAMLAACIAAIAMLWTLWKRRPAPVAEATSVVPGTQAPSKPYEEPASEHVDLDKLAFENSVSVVEATKASPSVFNEQSVLDLCKHAEFLQSLGKSNEAIALLEKRVHVKPRNCPLVYLQLLDVLHQTGRSAEYRVVRHGFMQIFNVNVPELASFQDKGNLLEAYPGVMPRITQLWHTGRVLEEIENCVFSGRAGGQTQRFDLAAFIELITLHGDALQTKSPPKQTRPPVADSEHINLDL